MALHEPLAYDYKASRYCPRCIIETLISEREASPAARDAHCEDALTMIAEANAIDRFDESSFDASEFPKVCFRWQLPAGERCERCGEEL